MKDIAAKYSLLDKKDKKEVNDFVDFLLNKSTNPISSKMNDYKKRIISIQKWSEDDLKVFDENNNLFNNWKIEEW